MKLKLVRDVFEDDCTLGVLFVDDEMFGYTLEDKVREKKIMGETAIPAGTYDVNLTPSPKYGRIMPLIKDVPGFTGVRIHAGNTKEDTEGCVLVGMKRDKKKILESKIAFERLFALMQVAVQKGERISIEVG